MRKWCSTCPTHRSPSTSSRTTSPPGVNRHRPEERRRTGPDGGELVEEAGPLAFVGARGGHGHVLVEARERGVEPAGEPEGAHLEEPLGVAQVIDEVGEGPLALGVAVPGPRLGDRPQLVHRVHPLRHEHVADVPAGHQVDVGEVVIGGVAALRTSGHTGS